MALVMMPVEAKAGGALSDWGKLDTAMNGYGGAHGTVAGLFEVSDDEASQKRTITLLDDISAVTGDSSLSVGGKIILDLNGHTLNGKIDDYTGVGSVIKVLEHTELTLEDNEFETDLPLLIFIFPLNFSRHNILRYHEPA